MFNWIPSWSFSVGFLSEVNAKVNGSNSIVCWDASGLGTAPFRMLILIASSHFLMHKCLKMLHLLCAIFLITSVVIINQKPLKFKWKAISAYYVESFMEIVVVRRPLKLCPFLILNPFSGTLCNIWGIGWLCEKHLMSWCSCFILLLAAKIACSHFCLLNFNWTYINYWQGW